MIILKMNYIDQINMMIKLLRSEATKKSKDKSPYSQGYVDGLRATARMLSTFVRRTTNS